MNKIKEFIFLVPAVLVVVAAVAGFRSTVPVFSQIIFPGEEDKEEPGITATRSADKKREESGEKKKEKKEKVAAVSLKAEAWKDGTYTGSGAGYGGPVVVEVQIVGGKIKSIRIVSHEGETPEYFSRAKKIIARILKQQTPEVDCIAEATLSSNGIRQAVAAALNKAGGKKVTATTTTVTKTSTKKTTESKKKEVVSKGVPADGTFTGSAQCENFGYTVSLAAKFREGKVVAVNKLKITGNDDPDNEAYWKKAWKPMVKKILKTQKKNGAMASSVDTVSGATYSSHAIVKAYLDAREKAIAKNNGKKVKEKKTNPSDQADTTPANLDEGEQNTQIQTTGTPKDGTYSVSASCEPDAKKAFTSYIMSADVTFKNGALAAMENFSSTDETNKKYYQKAVEGTKNSTGVVSQLLANQSVKGLQAVSGATCSSKTIRNLYLLAWNQATGETTTVVSDDEEMVTQTPAPSPSQTPIDSSGEEDSDKIDYSEIKDGIYPVCVMVYPDEDATNLWYSQNALNYILPQLIQKQKATGVDICSGATCSSEDFLNLYREALKKAKE